MNNNYDFWFWLNVMANMAQLESYNILLHDFNNNDLMKYLQHQDNDLLNEIIEQNKQIIELLQGGNKDAKNKHQESNPKNS